MPIHIPEKTNDKSVISGRGDTLFLRGEIDSVDPGIFLTPFFRAAREQMGETVKIDFTELEFLNSSGIKHIVSFVMDKKPGASIIFITDTTKTWQRTSLEVIQSLDEDSISIEERSS
ncbi:MAG: hypothetical protein MI863_01995 [Desulfobacterales bacterium]|nr:hypothetical protein [Desulfobacterales bacterium]